MAMLMLKMMERFGTALKVQELITFSIVRLIPLSKRRTS